MAVGDTAVQAVREECWGYVDGLAPDSGAEASRQEGTARVEDLAWGASRMAGSRSPRTIHRWSTLGLCLQPRNETSFGGS